jgi:hypothetical protein
MDENSLDLETLNTLLLNVVKQMNDVSLEDFAAAVDKNQLQEIILDTLGVAKQRLSPEEQKNFTALMKDILKKLQEYR